MDQKWFWWQGIMKLHFSFYLDHLLHSYIIQNESFWMAFVLEEWNKEHMVDG